MPRGAAANSRQIGGNDYHIPLDDSVAEPNTERLAVTTARASDYFGPRGTTQSPLGDLVIGAAIAGKQARVLGDPDQLHSYTYLLDAARTLVALGTRDDVVGEVFHIPNAPAQTTRQIIHTISQELGTPIKVSAAPRFVLQLMGLFNPTIAELDEMRYEFNKPFVVAGAKAQARLGIEPTPLAKAIAETVAWFRDRNTAPQPYARAPQAQA
ncbi:MAG: hypothetical protein ACHQ0J_08060 [Candidatus Dormibacterales bacterium]